MSFSVYSYVISAAFQCGLNLHEFVDAKSSPSVIAQILEHAGTDDANTLQLVMSIAAAESHFNNAATSSANARGIMQLTPVAIHDAAAFCAIPVPKNPYLLKNNVRLGTCYIQKLLTEYSGNEFLAVAAYNGGYRQAYNLSQPGKKLAAETAQYVPQVLYFKSACSSLDILRANGTRFKFAQGVLK